MNSLKSLALAALTLGGAFAVTAGQASAANVTVDFVVHNADASYGMIRTSSVPTYVSGLIDPAATISAGNNDPASGYAVFSAPAPAPRGSVSFSLIYGQAPDGSANPCTFTGTVSHDSQPQPYLLHFATSDATRCTVPADTRSSTGAFSGTFTLNWAS